MHKYSNCLDSSLKGTLPIGLIRILMKEDSYCNSWHSGLILWPLFRWIHVLLEAEFFFKVAKGGEVKGNQA